jgi:hypothetical protein
MSSKVMHELTKKEKMKKMLGMIFKWNGVTCNQSVLQQLILRKDLAF